jgi:hypothetical protein
VALLVASAVAILLAVTFGGAALGHDVAPFTHLGVPASHGARAWLLVAAMIGMAVLVWLVLRSDEDALWVSDGRGGVLVPAAPVVATAEGAACRHAEVVRAEAHVRGRRGRLVASVRVFCRPLADAARVGADVELEVRRALAATLGQAPDRLVVRPRVLGVRELKRHLP